MKTYKNTSRHPVVVRKNGKLTTITPGQTVELDQATANKAVPFLSEVVDQAAPQLLTEAPLPIEEKPVEEEAPVEEEKETVKIDVDGDGEPDLEVKGEVVEEEEESEEEQPEETDEEPKPRKKKKRK